MNVTGPHSRSFLTVLAIIFLISITVPSGAHALEATFIEIKCPGAQEAHPLGINNRGDVVGKYHSKDCSGCDIVDHAFLMRDGVCSEIVIPDADQAQAIGVNDHGDVVGAYVDVDGRERGFLFTDGTVTTIDVPDAHTTATAINNLGTIVGIYELFAYQSNHGFVLSRNGLASFDYPGGIMTHVTDINEHEDFVGMYTDGFGNHGFVFRDGIFTSIDYPGAISTSADGINNHGQIVGRYWAISGSGCFLYNGTNYEMLDSPGVSSLSCMKISDSGYVIGSYYTPGGSGGFLMHR